ncbi:OmpA family protein [Spongiivirga citrea]|uniref:OmpA family protein n=1 Tax=Spongiivirga citrea TaxID=1481457 RepID=A0A6M0CEW2_9FLAO|nr:OmpA family protein [Spongiivirga citrea]NER16365.1 OmpA family protein [Spongiivirga citrea]
MIKRILILILVLVQTAMFAQSKLMQKADIYFANYSYAGAIPLYEKHLKKNSAEVDAIKKLADSYFLTGNFSRAEFWYEKLMIYRDQVENIEDYMFRYSQSLKAFRQYKKADEWMEELGKINPEDRRYQLYKGNPQYLEIIEMNSDRFIAVNSPFNSRYNDFSPTFFNNDILFSSSMAEKSARKVRSGWSNQPFLNLYVYSNGKLSTLKGDVNGSGHESSAALSPDGTTLYFTRSTNSINTGKGILKIYMAKLQGSQWKNITEVSFNSEDFSTAHPTIDKTGKRLFFASNREGGFGESDLYEVEILGDGIFGEPKNLGPAINTEGRESFPFISSTNRLYFSSNGHPGLGMMDVFTCDFEKPNFQVYNIGEPVNSTKDDITFIVNEADKNGYFASNRDFGKGAYDIYQFNRKEQLRTDCESVVIGSIVGADQKNLIKNATVTLKDLNGNVLGSSKSDGSGSFSIPTSCFVGQQEVIVERDGYEKSVTTIKVSIKTPEVETQITLNEVAPLLYKDLITTMNLAPVTFGDKNTKLNEDSLSVIDAVVKVLQDNPSVSINIRSHTDLRRNYTFNLSLSRKRANVIKNYIVRKGISSDRLLTEGMGEIELKVNCGFKVRCSEEIHKQNRRIEFVVVSK